ncbi:MAG: hypothetical protein ACRDOK_28935, partial [Streptosporangiaceae bacterium]
MRENREVPRSPAGMVWEAGVMPADRRNDEPFGEGRCRKPEMHGRGKSDISVVPAKLPNNAGSLA